MMPAARRGCVRMRGWGGGVLGGRRQRTYGFGISGGPKGFDADPKRLLGKLVIVERRHLGILHLLTRHVELTLAGRRERRRARARVGEVSPATLVGAAAHATNGPRRRPTSRSLIRCR